MSERGTNKQQNLEMQLSQSHSSQQQQRNRIVILGSGFAGIQVLKRLQRKFRKNKNVNITLVSRDNFLLFTPMLPEVATGMIETRHIVTPVRTFLNRAIFYEAEVESIDFNSKQVKISHIIGRQLCSSTIDMHILGYDHLVIALGGETNFFGIPGVRENCFTMKDIDDAIFLRNHILNSLEQANLEKANVELTTQLLTFVIVGGGFNGVETVGVLNDFVRGIIKKYYHDINMAHVRVILVNAEDKILSQIDEKLGHRALEKLKQRGVEFIMSTQVTGVTASSATLDNGSTINSFTVVWSAGVSSTKLIAGLECPHDEHKRIIVNSHLEVSGYQREVYAIGDCATIIDPNTNKPYPPTAQHAIKQGEMAAYNIICQIEGNEKKKKNINYKTRGMMAEIGERYGVARIYGMKFHGFIAWWLWRTFYLSNMPTTSKRLKVMGDWASDLFFSPDVAMIKRFVNNPSVNEKAIQSGYSN